MARLRTCWLMKSEPDVFSIEDLERAGTAPWEGVRNYQARNFMRDGMRVGDLALFYHSSCRPPGVAGVCRICRSAYPDPSAWEPRGRYFDARSNPRNPVWLMVDVAFEERFPAVVPLDTLRAEPSLRGLLALKPGVRLSIQPVSPAHFRRVVDMGRAGTR